MIHPHPISEDPLDLAVLSAVPLIPVPPSGRSPAIDALRSAREGHGLIIGRDGPMLIMRRAWLELDMTLSEDFGIHLPYGSIGHDRLSLRCGYIPGVFLQEIVRLFRAALPNETAIFVIWNEETGTFSLREPEILEASPASLSYRPPVLAPNEHLIVDAHSHGRMKAFFSGTDDKDDQHTTKIAMVIGELGDMAVPSIRFRLCACGHFLPLAYSPFGRGEALERRERERVLQAVGL